MKKLSTITTGLFLSISAFAGNYGCNNQTGQAAQQCWEQFNGYQQNVVRNVYNHNKKFVFTDKNVPEQARARGKQLYADFERKCANGCNVQTWEQFNRAIGAEFGKYYKK